MKVRRVLKQISVFALIGTILATDITPAYAATSVAGVNETQDVSTNDTAECEVYAELGSNFLVTIPKKITLSGSTKTGSYSVDVEGDIAGNEYIAVIPDASFALSSANLASVTALINQDKTDWTYDEIHAGSDKVIGQGYISASGITAGSWNGSFWFNISFEEGTGSEDSKLEAGLYDANGIMTASWDELLDTGTITVTDGVLTSGYVASYKSYNTSSDALAGKLVIDDSVTSLGDNALALCASLISVTIPDGVTVIGATAFNGCTSLTSVPIPDSVTTIGDGAFVGCTALTSINIPNSVTTIDDRAFYGCTSLASIYIPSSVTSISIYVFGNCTSLASITVDENNTVYDSRENCNAIIETASNTLIAGCKNTVIPDSVTSIGAGAFASCTTLTSINIPNSVTSIGEHGFSSCSALTDIVIPDSMTSIDSQTFESCTSLASITIPDSVTSIGAGAFASCTTLTSINIPNSVTSIGGQAFYGCSALTDIVIPDSMTSIANSVFEKCTSLTSVTIPDSVTSIGIRTFGSCTSLASIYIPSSVSTISGTNYSNAPFSNCSSSLKIYCGASAKQSGWGSAWNYYKKSGKLSVTYGVTREEYETNYK